MSRIATTVAGVLVLAAALTGCGKDHNEQDVAFATGMVEHHAQAIQMANYTIGREGIDPRIAELAEEIRVAQTAEIDEMAGMLRAWGEEVPETGFATGDSHSHSMEHGADHAGDHAEMPGMMSAQEMAELAEAPDATFDRMWIEMMIEHHQGALEMVDEVRSDGEHEELRNLAEQMEEVQRTEIGDLERWLADS